MEGIKHTGQGDKGNLHCCCADWICLGEERSQVQDMHSSPPLQSLPLKYNSFNGKKPHSDLTDSTCLSLMRNYYMFSPLTGKVS